MIKNWIGSWWQKFVLLNVKHIDCHLMHLFKTQLAARQIINSLNFLFENCDFIKDFQFFGVALSMVLLLSLGMSSQWKSFNYFHPRGCGKNYDGNVSRQPHICGGMNHVVKYQWQSPKVNGKISTKTVQESQRHWTQSLPYVWVYI